MAARVARDASLLRADSQQCMNERLLSGNALTTGTSAMLATTDKRSKQPEWQLFIDPRTEADSQLSAQLQPFASTPITIIFMRGTSVVLPSQSNN